MGRSSIGQALPRPRRAIRERARFRMFNGNSTAIRSKAGKPKRAVSGGRAIASGVAARLRSEVAAFANVVVE